jgi:hypothetical protein
VNLGLDDLGFNRLSLDAGRVQDFLRKMLSDGQKVLQPVFAAELKVLMEKYVSLAAGREA